ncbi:MAG: molecular chaperone HtpG [Proteobacteria bacterium]|nr:molecular chaperone HtpG [Pseudomonadota bacterium]MBU1738258.1 molecular chaperone HtpG [Pseudomonadota bacterium]
MSPKTETREFQAEVKKMLDIVIHSLYTERDIFLRELISNSADALEKFRHQRLLDENVFDDHLSLEIKIDCNDKEHVLTITDTGIGMTRDELVDNLGTIAHSGSKTFLTHLDESARKEVNLIGQFGVGFYAAFMVAESVSVQSRSYLKDEEGHEWSSDGTGSYTISPCTGIHRGTKIIIRLKKDAYQYADESEIKRIITRYSSFVSFPIKVGGEEVNTVQALWARSKSEIKDEEYNEFYKFIGNAVDEPSYRLHFTADAPLAIKALLFSPKENFESLGFGRVDPGVSLYCRKVLIEQHSKNILPDWLRYLKGVVDSEDMPLNISRQALQDNALVVKINRLLTKRYLKHLEEEAKADPDKYLEFWRDFGIYLKEGVTSDFTHREAIAKLLRFESSATEPGKMISLEDYVGRMREGQDKIYYINGPSREALESGPYVEAFRKRKLEIIYTLEPIDDFAFSHLGEFAGKKLVSADRADLELPEVADESGGKDEAPGESVAGDRLDTLVKWMQEVLGTRIKEVQVSKRLEGSPAIIVNPDGFMTSSMERIMRAAKHDSGLAVFGNKNLEINPRHQLIRGLDSLRDSDEEFARSIVEQIHDNAMIQAGLMVEPRDMVERSYRILERAVGKGNEK